MNPYGEYKNKSRLGSGPSRPEVPDPRERFKSLPDPPLNPDDEPLPVDERLAMRGHGFRAQARSSSTQQAYQRDFQHFKDWCDKNYYRALPASEQTIEFYLNDNWEKLAISTLERRLIGISHAHKKAGYESPTKSELVRETLKGIRRAVARQGRSRPNQALPLLMEDIKELVGSLDLTTLTGLRDRVVLLLGFAAAFRAEEHGIVHVSDLKKHRRGYLLHLRKSKTDQEGKSAPVSIPRLDDTSICPSHAIDEWLKASGIKEGPLLRGINCFGKIKENGLSRHGITYIIKRCAKNAGWEDTESISGHSLRRGLATEAHIGGASEIDIKRQGRWKSDKVRLYIHEASAYVNNAAVTALTRGGSSR